MPYFRINAINHQTNITADVIMNIPTTGDILILQTDFVDSATEEKFFSELARQEREKSVQSKAVHLIVPHAVEILSMTELKSSPDDSKS